MEHLNMLILREKLLKIIMLLNIFENNNSSFEYIDAITYT